VSKISPEYYKGSIEVWDFIHAQQLDYFQGNVVKYIVRYKEKNGMEDLLKCKAYIDKMIQCQSQQ
jgi:hypothetical protein